MAVASTVGKDSQASDAGHVFEPIWCEVVVVDSNGWMDPRSEMLLLSTDGNTKNLLVTAIDIEGAVDEEAWVPAIRRASTCFPHLLSTVREIKVNGLRRLLWEHRPDLRIPTTVWEVRDDGTAHGSLNDLLTPVAFHLDKERDLFQEVPVDFHLIRRGPHRSMLIGMFHHVTADGATVAEFGKEFFAQYHEIKTGKRPEWAQETHAISSSAKRQARSVGASSWRDALMGVRQTMANLFDKPTLPAGTGDPHDLGEHQIKRALSEEETSLVLKRAASYGASPIDLFTACSKIAVDRWNEARGIAPGLLTCSVTVNARGRFGVSDQPNNSSVIFFRSEPEQRRELKKLCRKLAVTRINHFRNHQDIKYMQDIERMINSLRLLPFRMRRKIVHNVVNRHQFSIGVTLLGAVWPKMKNGKPSTETALTNAADLSLREVHAIGYKLLSGNHAMLVAYTFRNRLNLVLAGSACRFTRKETEDFLDLIVKILVGDSPQLR
ncbi:MAG: condensation domain-containing protein [Thermodesulfobacteriota bacterium]